VTVPAAGAPVITASMLYAHLSCPHRVSMDAHVDPARRDAVSPFVEMLWERGTLYETEVISGLGVDYLDLSHLEGDEKERATRAAIERRVPLIYSARLSVEGLLGVPDLLRLEEGGYVAIDIKSGAGKELASDGGDDDSPGKPKLTYGVQIALYTDLLSRLGVSPGWHGYIWDIHRREVRYDLMAPLGPKSPSIWERYLEVRAKVAAALQQPGVTRPAMASICKACVWRTACTTALREAQDLSLLPELGRSRRDVLAGQFPTVRDLAVANLERFFEPGGKKTTFRGVGPEMLRKFQRRAALLQERSPQPYLTRPWQAPASEVELFLDIETDPLRDWCYLHGVVIREQGRDETERFEAFWMEALSPAAERDAFAAVWALIQSRPQASIYVYSSYEKAQYRRLAARYPDVCAVEDADALFGNGGRVVDLYHGVVRPSSEWATEDFSIKTLAKKLGFKWRDADPSGASSIQWFDEWARTGNATVKQRILDYNEDDCRAMRVLLEGLKRLPVKP
jgi:predicted RecB family nuclease